MKYVFIFVLLLGCKGDPQKTGADRDTTAYLTIKPGTDSLAEKETSPPHNDTIQMGPLMDTIFRLPEVQDIHKKISKSSRGAHGVSMQVSQEFNGNSSYYCLRVGDNSREDRYYNIFIFLIDKKTKEIKAYDTVLDSIMSLEDWRRTRE